MTLSMCDGSAPMPAGNCVPSCAISIVDIGTLIAHEDVNIKHINILTGQVKSDGFLKRAVVVDKNTKIILDGHHRIQALKELGCSKVPVIFVDYSSPDICARHWSSGEIIDKRTIILAALSGKIFQPKTSRHIVAVDGSQKHISFLERRIDIPLEELR